MNRLLICSFIFCQYFFCQAQNLCSSAVWNVGLIQEFQKFDQFSNVRIQQSHHENVFAFNLGFSPQKAVQNIFAPALSLDYARLWKIHRVYVGPVIVFSFNTHVFGTRFNYLHASVGYRFVLGEHWQFFQESSFGPTTETFAYLEQKNQQFAWNYHLKLGIQHAFR